MSTIFWPPLYLRSSWFDPMNEIKLGSVLFSPLRHEDCLRFSCASSSCSQHHKIRSKLARSWFEISWSKCKTSCTNDSICHSLLHLWNRGYERQTFVSRVDGKSLLITFQNPDTLTIFSFCRCILLTKNHWGIWKN